MRKKQETSLIVLGVIFAIIFGVIKIIIEVISKIVELISAIISLIIFNIEPIGIIILICGLLFLTPRIFSFFYFRSNKFKILKDSISKHTKNCNDLNHYIGELKCSYVNISSYDFGQSRMVDTSNYNFNRREWNKDIRNSRTHLCSASVCKNASIQPLKYFCKYFDVEMNEQSLSNFEGVLNDFMSVEEGKVLLQHERDELLCSINKSIPWLITSFSKNKLIKKLGFEDIDLSDLYIPIFTFQYVSPGGNSSFSCNFKLTIVNLNKLIIYLNDVIKWRATIAGQRALMTSKLRKKIKKRDNYTCCECNLSIEDEQNLLLEIDHIIPLSKGGLTTEDNLQTLCWRCNRTKGSKIENR